jgi:RNA polymerase sigma-70 factor (ECF subfamily)
MSGAQQVTDEAQIRAAFDGGDLHLAASRLLEAYGSEILRFLASRLRDPELTSEVFGDFTEDLWRGFGGFRWECSARAWAYTLARHAASRAIRQKRRRAGRSVPLSRAGPLSEIAERVRSQTALLLRTESRERLADLRRSLPELEQTILILRVNRQLPWVEIARILAVGPLDGVMALTPEVLNAEATRLRKRFQKAKEKLRKLAADAGLLGD